MERDIIEAYVQDKGEHLSIAMALRSSKLRQKFRDQTMRVLTGTRIGDCSDGDHDCYRTRRTIKFSRRDVCLCPRETKARAYTEGGDVHILIQRSSCNPPADFVIYSHSSRWGRMLCPGGTTVWRSEGVKEERLKTWKEIQACLRRDDAESSTKQNSW